MCFIENHGLYFERSNSLAILHLFNRSDSSFLELQCPHVGVSNEGSDTRNEV